MGVRNLCDNCGKLLRSYNLFVPNEDDYDDDTSCFRDPSIVLKHQRYATRVYVPLLIVTFYILFVVAFLNAQTRMITVSDLTPSHYDQLRREHGETLSCPCSDNTVPYGTFVNHTISFHPVCTSVFISKEWIHALNLANASAFLMMDFRTTASSQFELLAALCWFFQQTVSQVRVNLDNNQFISIELLPPNEVRSQIDTTVKFAQTSTSVQTSVLLYFLQITLRSNSLVSALNTNAALRMDWMPPYSRSVFVSPTTYFESDSVGNTDDSLECDVTDITRPAGFYSSADNHSSINQAYWDADEPTGSQRAPSVKIDGFFGGCTPLDAVLASTFACLHNASCLELLAGYFPGLNQLNDSYVVPLPLSKQKNVSLNRRLADLLIEDWSTEIDYTKYFAGCAPTFCTYTEVASTSFSYAITLLLSLYGGLVIVLRLIATISVKMASKFKRYSIDNHSDVVVPNVTCLRRVAQWIKHLNLFKSAKKRTPTDLKQQRISTRLYLVLFASSTLVLLLFTSLRVKMQTKTESNPSLLLYEQLHKLYPDTLRCRCSKEIMPYSTFISLSPILHEICASDFVSESWLAMMTLIKDSWEGLGVVHFRLLSALCRLSNRTIDDAVRGFKMRSMATSYVLPKLDFKAEIDTAFNQFNQTLIINFGLLVDAVRLLMQVDQPFQIPRNRYDVSDEIFDMRWSLTTAQYRSEVSFRLLGTTYSRYAWSTCICATDPQCRASYNEFLAPFESRYDGTLARAIKTPGMVLGCYAMESLLLSTLECVYSDVCLSRLYSLMSLKDTSVKSWFDTYPLAYQPTSTRFALNASLGSIVREMMIEQWSLSFSFDRYYDRCAPSNCTYSYPAHTMSVVVLMVTLLSSISGLTVVLHLLADSLIQIIFYLLQSKTNRPREVHPKLSIRMKSMLSTLAKLVCTKLVDLNMFPLRHFRGHVDPIRGKRLGQLTTRLYIVLLISGLIVLLLYTIVQPEKLTYTFPEPSLETYKHLMTDHNDTLQCPCSLISSTYDRYVTIEPVFHQICTSAFVLNEWRTAVTAGLAPDLLHYVTKDYRRFLSAHLQFLSGLCGLSIQLVNDFVRQFLSSVWTTTQLQSPRSFQTHIDTLVQQSKSNAPATFFRLLSFLRSMNHGNALVSTYGTNFEYYFSNWFNTTAMGYPQLSAMARSKAIFFDNECSCALSSSCTAPAAFINANGSNITLVKGLKVGCTPSESFFASTLECFYDPTCISLIREQTGSRNSSSPSSLPTPLLEHSSRFLRNTTILELTSELFVETWSTTIDHSAYFVQCSPKFCSYTYIQKVNSFYTFTLLSGLYGGLSVVLKWICPNIVYLLARVYDWQKRRSSGVQPRQAVPMTITEPANAILTTTDVFNTAVAGEPSPTTSTSRFKCAQLHVLLISLFLLVLFGTALVGPSIYLSRRNPSDSKTTYMTVGTTDSTMTSLTSAESSCQLTFQTIVSYTSSNLGFAPAEVTVNDFNSDGHLDVAIVNRDASNIGILLGRGNATFESQVTYTTGSNSFPASLVIGDFNRDDHLDLCVNSWNLNSIDILHGNGNGTFARRTRFRMPSNNRPSSIAADDFNSDGRSDLAVVTSGINVDVLLNQGNGTFAIQRIFASENDLYLLVADMNSDNAVDLVVLCTENGDIYVFFGVGNGTFARQMSFSTGPSGKPVAIVAGHFNWDSRMDLAVVYARTRKVGILLGSSAGTFEDQVTYPTGLSDSPMVIAAGDFNNDDQLDLVVAKSQTNTLGILLGRGNGTFQKQTVFLIGLNNEPRSVTIGDFNDDGKLDLVFVGKAQDNLIFALNTCY